ncbi:DUF7310 family coiled-coil domain-containing protein [Haloarchaeobius sp. DFWS5]|uniref:DUF7310 family coiled-coil domain-containing protein n=1 Tax=Haloarchaeobius sp. DFWS5 TaxID=3446114 RepID=UPI003EC11420
MSAELDDRLRAVERAIDGASAAAGGPAVQTDDRTAALADRLAEVETTVAELDAAVQALRGYAGNVRHVDERVEQRADSALAVVESLEERVEELEEQVENRAGDSEPTVDRVTGADRQHWQRHAGCDDRQPARDMDWPTPAPPRYREPDHDDDRKRPGLVARLRDVI